MTFYRLSCNSQNDADFFVRFTLGHPVEDLAGALPKSECAKFSNVTVRTLYTQYHDGSSVIIASESQMQADVTTSSDKRAAAVE